MEIESIVGKQHRSTVWGRKFITLWQATSDPNTQHAISDLAASVVREMDRLSGKMSAGKSPLMVVSGKSDQLEASGFSVADWQVACLLRLSKVRWLQPFGTHDVYVQKSQLIAVNQSDQRFVLPFGHITRVFSLPQLNKRQRTVVVETDCAIVARGKKAISFFRTLWQEFSPAHATLAIRDGSEKCDLIVTMRQLLMEHIFASSVSESDTSGGDGCSKRRGRRSKGSGVRKKKSKTAATKSNDKSAVGNVCDVVDVHGADVFIACLVKLCKSIKIVRPSRAYFSSDDGNAFCQCTLGTEAGVLYPLGSGLMYLGPRKVLFFDAKDVVFVETCGASHGRYFELVIEDSRKGKRFSFGMINRCEVGAFESYVRSVMSVNRMQDADMGDTEDAEGGDSGSSGEDTDSQDEDYMPRDHDSNSDEHSGSCEDNSGSVDDSNGASRKQHLSFKPKARRNCETIATCPSGKKRRVAIDSKNPTPKPGAFDGSDTDGDSDSFFIAVR